MGRARTRKRTVDREQRIGGRIERRSATHDPERQALATHEAGHIVSLLAVNQDVEYAWIRRGHGYNQPLSPQWFKDMCANGARPEMTLTAEQETYIKGRIVSMLAGPIAEAILAEKTGVVLPPEPNHPERDDVQAFTMAHIVCHGDKDAARRLYAQMLHVAHVGVDNETNWAAITAVARILMERGHISHQQIHTITKPATQSHDTLLKG